jgi:hypothetical protein
MPTVGCNGFTCGATTCNTTCTVATNAGCDATHYCVGGNSCMPRQTNGASCAFAFQCANNNCTQGQGGLICASVACPTACSVVNAAGTTCVAATNGSDPKNDCTVSVANCKQDNCNGSTGANACNVSDNTSCGTPSCTAGTETDQLCMTGTCTSTPKNCNNFMCTVPGSGGVCVTSCTVGADTGCKMGFYCVAGTSCVAKGGPGAVCAAADQCTSGLCGTTGSGHCCTAACTTGGTCGATDCNPIGACAYPTGTTSCGAAASCSGSTLTPPGSCNSNGS